MKIIEKWVLYRYVGRDITPLSKPFKSKKLAEQARQKYSERERKSIGLGMVRVEK